MFSFFEQLVAGRNCLITIGLIVLFAGPALARGGPDRPPAAQKTGQIKGLIDYCGATGADDLLVHIFGTSFQSIPRPGDGGFTLFWIPPGTYSVVVEIPNAPPYTFENVVSADNTITDLGLQSICRDIDGDGFSEELDCNDLNVSINPAAPEACDGVDNDCDGAVDEECSLCTDSDGDGFYAQAGCLTQVDCDDEDQLTSPVAVEVCDSIDNDCDGFVNEGFDTATDPFNCGSCGVVCSLPNADVECAAGACGFVSCWAGSADCDFDLGNGCEVDLSTAENCGACGLSCQEGWGCSSGVCVPPSCEAGQILCPDGYCVSEGEFCHCFDGIWGDDETDVDCGGADCSGCATGQVCNVNTDCLSGVCSNGLCAAAT